MTTTFEQQTGYVALDQEAEYAALTSYYGLSYGTTIPEDTPNIISGQDFNSPSFDSQYAQTFAGSHSKFDPPHGTAQDSPYISDGYSFDQQSGPVSILSGPSLASAESSALGSPRSIPPLVQVSSSVWGELVDPSAAAGPDIVQGDGLLTDYRDSWTNLDPSFQQDIEFSDAKISDGFVDPSLLIPYGTTSYDLSTAEFGHQSSYPITTGSRAASPALSTRSQLSHQGSTHMRSGHPSPRLHAAAFHPYARRQPPLSRHSSVNSAYSYASDGGNAPVNFASAEDQLNGPSVGRESYCQDCNRNFRDLKAHRLTHQEERPVKCPIPTCSYFLKGFSRKYDCQRHTLTHYKGTMVCDFCPGAGTAGEKSFNRADVFKRHLLSVHNVEQSPHNGRKKASPVIEDAKATGKCSTCSLSFGTAQALFEHLDECVYKKVTEEDPTAAITESNLLSVAEDDAVLQEHLGHRLMTGQPWSAETVDPSDETGPLDDQPPNDGSGGAGTGRMYQRKVRKGPTVFTFSQGGVPLTGKRGRKRGKKQPYSWGKDPEQMTVRKRAVFVHDGPRRLWKDDMMLSTEDQIQEPLANDPMTGEARWLTALDHYTMKRTEAIHNATEEEKGEWRDEDGNLVKLDELLKGSSD